MDEDYVELELTTALTDTEGALRDAEDKAWEHAKESAELMGFEMGGDEFVGLFTTLNERYTHQVEHLTFFMTTALLLTKAMLESGFIALLPEKELFTEQEIMEKVGAITETIVNSYMWLTAGYELTWLSNEELPNEVTVKFLFDPNDIEQNEEEDYYGDVV